MLHRLLEKKDYLLSCEAEVIERLHELLGEMMNVEDDMSTLVEDEMLRKKKLFEEEKIKEVQLQREQQKVLEEMEKEEEEDALLQSIEEHKTNHLLENIGVLQAVERYIH